MKWPAASPTETVRVRQRFVQLFPEDPVTGMKVTACGILDVICASPISTATTDDRGYVDITVPRGFNGYLSLAPPTSFPSMMPALSWFFPPPDADSLPAEISILETPHLITLQQLKFLLAEVDGTADPALGHMLSVALGCDGHPTAGVSVNPSVVDKSTVAYYVPDNGLPSVTERVTGPRGEFGFANLPPGPQTLEAFVPSIGKPMGRATVLVRAGHVSYVPIAPSPL